MDGTLLEKKYDIVGRIEALEAGGEQVVYLPGDGISIQEVEEGEREVSVLHDSSLSIDPKTNKLSVDFTQFDPLLYSSNNKTQIGVAVINGHEYPLYRKWLTGITLPNNAVLNVPTSLTNERIIKLYGIAVNNSGSVAVLPYVSPSNLSWAIDLGYSLTTHNVQIGTAIDYSNFTGDVVIEFVEIPAQESKKKTSK